MAKWRLLSSESAFEPIEVRGGLNMCDAGNTLDVTSTAHACKISNQKTRTRKLMSTMPLCKIFPTCTFSSVWAAVGKNQNGILYFLCVSMLFAFALFFCQCAQILFVIASAVANQNSSAGAQLPRQNGWGTKIAHKCIH